MEKRSRDEMSAMEVEETLKENASLAELMIYYDQAKIMSMLAAIKDELDELKSLIARKV